MDFMRFNLIEFLERGAATSRSNLMEILDELPQSGEFGPWLAGGALRRTFIGQDLDSDFDFFFASEAQRDTFIAELIELGAKQVSKNEHQQTYIVDAAGAERKVQCVCIRYYAKPEDVIDSFDFTITQFAYDGTDVVCGKYSLWDLGQRRLVLHKLTFGVATMRRMIKYVKQGFTACAGCMQSILEAAAANPSVIQSDIQYID